MTPDATPATGFPRVWQVVLNAMAVGVGLMLVFAMFAVLVNLLMDLVYVTVDPRIRVK